MQFNGKSVNYIENEFYGVIRMQIPLLKIQKDGSTQLTLVDLEDILYIKIENRNIVYHTLDEQYRHISTLSDLEEHLFNYGFDLLDKTNLVNMNRIRKLDSKHGNIYFEDTPTQQSKFASIAFIKQKLLKDEIEKTIAKNKNSEEVESLEIKASDEKAPTNLSASRKNEKNASFD